MSVLLNYFPFESISSLSALVNHSLHVPAVLFLGFPISIMLSDFSAKEIKLLNYSFAFLHARAILSSHNNNNHTTKRISFSKRGCEALEGLHRLRCSYNSNQ
jgi:hypothetical protein